MRHQTRRLAALALAAALVLPGSVSAWDMVPSEEDRTISIVRGDRVYICVAPGEPQPAQLRRALAQRSREVAAAGGGAVARGRDVFLLTERFAASGEGCGPLSSATRDSIDGFMSIGSAIESILQERLGMEPGPAAIAAGEGDCGLIVNLDAIPELDEQPVSLIGYPEDSAACAAGVMSVVRLTPAP